MMEKKVNVRLSVEYTNAETGAPLEPNSDLVVNWRDMSYCGMVEIQGQILMLLVDLNQFAKEQCEGDEASKLLRDSLKRKRGG